MTDEQENPPVEEVPEESGGPRAGERLAIARREQGIGIHEVAKELHLEEVKVRALESNEFDALGAPVFAKGHLKKYAQLVGLDVAELLEDFHHLTRSDPPPPIVSVRPKVRQELSPGPWVAAIVLIVVAASAYWWFVMREQPRVVRTPAPASVPTEGAGDQPARSESVRLPAAAADMPAGNDDVADGPSADDQGSDVAETVRDQGAVTAAGDPPAAPVAGDNVALTVEFSGDCWTEISDADGRRLFFAMGRDGQTVELSGKAPLAALFGNGDNVRLLVDGSEYSLPVSNSSNRTLRLTIDGL